MEYKWPLSVPQFSFLDKLKAAAYLLTNDRWTHGKKVEEFEKCMADYVGVNYAIFTSSGSTANTLLAMMLRDLSPEKNVIIFPSTTWITSVSPFLREGFTPQFIDINLNDFSIDLFALEKYLKDNHTKVACIFVTSLIGFTPNLGKLQTLSIKYGVTVMMDNCENTLGQYANKNISSYFTSTTSTYFGHQLQSVEGGFIFTNNEYQNDYCLMARNHGMLRHLQKDRQELYRNQTIDPLFDFFLLGNNFRNTNINALLGLYDLKRADDYLVHRRYLYSIFFSFFEGHFILPIDDLFTIHAPFCLPIITKPEHHNKLEKIKAYCDKEKIERRPIISGNLLRQTCLAREDYASFVNSEYLHNHGFYIGLHGATKERDVMRVSRAVLGILHE